MSGLRDRNEIADPAKDVGILHDDAAGSPSILADQPLGIRHGGQLRQRDFQPVPVNLAIVLAT